MAKSRKNNILKSVEKTSNKVLPVVDKSLKTVGSTAKDVAKISLPVASSLINPNPFESLKNLTIPLFIIIILFRQRYTNY